ncbi:MAG: thiol-disulfide oxidoreductase DCC family protein [Ignavibacteria bacterium]
MNKRGNKYSIILFDGVCNFCNKTIDFIIDRDRENKFKFAALQSEAGKGLLKKFDLKTDELDTLILIEGDKYFERSTAILRIARDLRGMWKLFYSFIIIPPYFRDIAYNIIAKHRYRWFGKREQCRVPTAELREKFLE